MIADQTDMHSIAATRRTPSQARGKQRTENILQAAAEVFDEVGYDNANTILIAKRANTAVGSLYDFFPNKESIAQVLIERHTHDLATLLDGLITEAVFNQPIAQILDQLIEPLVRFISGRAGFRGLYLNAPHVGDMSALQRTLETMLMGRMSALVTLRYPAHDPAEITRSVRVCMAIFKSLSALAIQGHRADASSIDLAMIAELKTVLGLYLDKQFGPT
ncbi:MAG: TetR/AcrR family transcriptional regulator [Anaerolineae bacterium]|nr:TetR/AcrR family transcriptional regulator [Anaerolineae bacterium]